MPSPTNPRKSQPPATKSPQKTTKPEPETAEVDYKATEPELKAATEHLWKTYTVINEWIRFADAKAGALLAVNGVLIGAALGKIDGKQQFHPDQRLYWIALVLAVLCAIFLIVSAACSLWCINPILKLKNQDSAKKSTIYFEHIASAETQKEFYGRILAVKGEQKAFEEIADQVLAVSKVAKTKHLFIKISVLTMAAGLAFGVGLLGVLTQLTFAPFEGTTL